MTDVYMRPNEPTILRFHDDSYQQSVFAWVDDHGVDKSGRNYLITSETIFYPHGGGQKGDRGYIHLTNDAALEFGVERLQISDTRSSDGFVHHILTEPQPKELIEKSLVGVEKYKLSIDWAFRIHQMRLHSTAHLLHCFIERVLGREVEHPSISDIREDHGLNKYDIGGLLTLNQLSDVLRQMNDWTKLGHRISTYKDPDPSKPDWFRWWECAEWKIPCGGTHPRDTSEIGIIAAELNTKKSSTSLKFWLEP